jgi:hypothetical protein
MTDTLIEVTNISTGKRQIGPKEAVLVRIEQKQPEIAAAIAAGVAVSGDALREVPDVPGWAVSELNFHFGVTLTADAGVIVAHAGADASFDVSVTFVRK